MNNRKIKCLDCEEVNGFDEVSYKRTYTKKASIKNPRIEYISKINPKDKDVPFEEIGQHETLVWHCNRCDSSWKANKEEMSTNRISMFHECGKNKEYLFEFMPELLKEWHPSKNYSTTKESITIGSSRKFWWVCESGHEWETTASGRKKGTGCPNCAQKGFKPLEPAILYFLYNREYKSYKVGITNINTKANRVKRFESLGWECLLKIENKQGALIRDMETIFFRWIRKEKNIPIHLTWRNFGTVKGASETFSAEAISRREVLTKIKAIESQII